MPDIPNNGTTGALIPSTGQYTGSLETNGDSDWWKISVTAGMQYELKLNADMLSATPLDNGRIVLHDEFGNTVKGVYKGDVLSFTSGITGTYFIEVVDWQSSDSAAEGDYSIQANMSDTVVNNASTTATLSNGISAVQSLGQEGDSDWFKVTLTSGRSYAFTVDGDGSGLDLDNARLNLKDADGNTVAYGYDGSAVQFTPTVGGTYYIEVVDFQSEGLAEGSYRINAQLSDTIQNNNTTTSNLASNATILSKIDAPGDTDWHRVTLQKGLTYGFQISGDGTANTLSDPDVYLRDADGTLLVYGNISSGTTSTIAYTVDTAGTYYVQAGNSGDTDVGNYILKNIATDFVRNDVNTAASLGDGASILGRVDVSTDADWYKFTAVAGRSYTFSLSGNGSATELAAQRLILRNATGTILAQDSNSSDGNTATFTFTATTSGTWFVDASGYYTDSAGGFRLSVVSTSPVITGTSGNDTLTGGSGNTTIYGGDGADSLFGGDGNDTIYGGAGNDRLYGGNGNDLLRGDLGNDYIAGGAGTDTALFSGSTAITANLALTTAQNTGQGSDTFFGVENLTSGSGNDRLTGNSGANALTGGIGNDSLYGGAGNDMLRGDAGNDLLNGGTGLDTALYVGSANASVSLATTAAQATGYGLDTLTGIENITTGSGNDHLTGNALANVLTAGTGNDSLYGGAGNDTLRGDLGNDRISGGDGTDTAVYTGSTAIRVDLSITAGQTTGQGFDTLTGIENLLSGSASDRLIGNASNNIMSSGAGNDSLYGGSGSDHLIGGSGSDLLSGGSGSDYFEFGRGSDNDRIADFHNDADTIVLHGLEGVTAANAIYYASQIGTSVVFDFGQGDTLTVLHATTAQLTNDILIG